MSTHASSALNMESCSKCCIQDTLSSRAFGMAAFRAIARASKGILHIK